jgi:hypothetical protein
LNDGQIGYLSQDAHYIVGGDFMRCHLANDRRGLCCERLDPLVMVVMTFPSIFVLSDIVERYVLECVRGRCDRGSGFDRGVSFIKSGLYFLSEFRRLPFECLQFRGVDCS